MKTALFDYYLPKELIAQSPAQKREKAKLLVVDRSNGLLKDALFEDIVSYIPAGDVLVLNNTRVIPARLYGIREKTGAKIEFFLLEEVSPNVWDCLTRPARRVKKGEFYDFGLFRGEVLEEGEQGHRLVRFFGFGDDFLAALKRVGKVPLPPYIKNDRISPAEYQTVYARRPGAVAAPTAGLHFSRELLKRLRQKGVIVTYITLHCGLGTFQPVKTEEIEEHKMHYEHYEISRSTAQTLQRCKSEGRNIWAVGTTVVRTLEHIMRQYGEFRADRGKTNLFIYPPYQFRAVDHLITNFHLPKSTLLMLVSAFAGYKLTMTAYDYAVQHKYRFFSFGDAMLII